MSFAPFGYCPPSASSLVVVSILSIRDNQLPDPKACTVALLVPVALFFFFLFALYFRFFFLSSITSSHACIVSPGLAFLFLSPSCLSLPETVSE